MKKSRRFEFLTKLVGVTHGQETCTLRETCTESTDARDQNCAVWLVGCVYKFLVSESETRSK